MSIFVVASTDLGAPTLNGVNGTFITVADYVLVTIAGYTKTFSGTNKGIYKPPFGLGYSIRFVHDSAVSGGATNVTVRGIENATGIDTYINPYPLPSQAADANVSVWATSITANSTARPYMFIVSDGAPGGPPPFIYFLGDIGGAGVTQNNAWGEGAPVEAVDNYCSYLTIRGVTGSSGLATSFTLNAITTSTNTPKLFWARSRDGSIISSQGFLYRANSSLGNIMGTWTGGPAYPHPDTGGLHMQKVPMCDIYSSLTGTPGYGQNHARAYMPNFWNVLHGTTYTGITHYDTFELDASTSGGIAVSATFTFIKAGANTSSFAATVYEITPTWSGNNG